MEVIIDKMLNDGVITNEDVKSLRNGKSIFSFSNNFYFDNFNDNVTVTEIMGRDCNRNFRQVWL